ncbi:MAG: hypothetical protein Q9O62_14415 [Ardenticatenia bacterium]|nr:hypothetical protein [Ardenticatenia bacterium]
MASHDGIGVMPAHGLLTAEEIQALVERTLAHGGHVSYKANPDGSRSVYELNITLYDVLNDPRTPNPQLDVARFMASQAIMLSRWPACPAFTSIASWARATAPGAWRKQDTHVPSTGRNSTGPRWRQR